MDVNRPWQGIHWGSALSDIEPQIEEFVEVFLGPTFSCQRCVHAGFVPALMDEMYLEDNKIAWYPSSTFPSDPYDPKSLYEILPRYDRDGSIVRVPTILNGRILFISWSMIRSSMV